MSNTVHEPQIPNVLQAVSAFGKPTVAGEQPADQIPRGLLRRGQPAMTLLRPSRARPRAHRPSRYQLGRIMGDLRWSDPWVVGTHKRGAKQ
ncbi:MAG: hypothetical protein ACOC8L_07610 [Spirochaetota bacterium]